MTPAPVLTSVEGSVLTITLNRSEARNCVNRALAEGVADALELLDHDPSLRVGVFTGAGSSFSAGMDLKAFSEEGDLPLIDGRGFAGMAERSARKPLIAAVEGFAVGGGLEIALACDIIVAAADAKLGLPEVRVGLVAGAGGLLRLPRRIGPGQSALLGLTGAPISGEEGHRIGLVDVLVESGGALARAQNVAATIAGNGPLAVETTKLLLRGAFDSDEPEFWGWQAPHFDAVANSADALEGARAFIEKRAPRWAGTESPRAW
jgi:enoyl-CoA hydratase/carnithine racemase